MQTILDYFKNFFFPIQCLLCNRVGNWLCTWCENRLWPTIPECYFCRTISTGYCTHISCINKGAILSRVIVGWQYNKDSRELIKTLKYRKATAIINYIADLYIKRLKEIFVTNETITSKVLICPVPANTLQTNQRGFNQSDLIAKELANKLDIIYRSDLLSRNINIGHQAGRSKEERLSSKNSFCLNPKYFELVTKLNEVIIFDDVMSTGTTLTQCAAVLHAANPRLKLSSMILFRGKPPRNKRAHFISELPEMQ